MPSNGVPNTRVRGRPRARADGGVQWEDGGEPGISGKASWALSGRQGEPAKGFEQGSRAIRTMLQEDKSGNTRRVEWRPQNHVAR